MDTGMYAAGMAQPPDLSLMQLAVYGVLLMMLVLFVLTVMAVASLPVFFAALYAMELGLGGVQSLPDPVGKYAKIGGLVFRSLRRNLVRTALTYVALFVLTGMLTMIYGIVATLGALTQEKEDQQMVLMTEKFGIPSMLPPGYAARMKQILKEELPPENRPADVEKNFMTWSFVGGSTDQERRTQENSMFLFALDPDAVPNGMMTEQGLNKEDLGDDNWAALLEVIEVVKRDKRHIVVGEDRLKILNKQVGDELRFYSTNYKDIAFDFKIVGAFPTGSRLAGGAAMRYDYLTAKLDEYKAQKGQDHPNAGKCLNLIWVRMPNKASYQALAAIVNEPGKFSAPAAKMETFAAAIGSFIEPFKDIFWGMKYIVMPAVLVIMCLVIGITITIGVRERWTEMAMLKVLGFQPWQVMGMVVSEAVLIGVYGGMLSTWCVYFLPLAISKGTKAIGVKFPFFDSWKTDPMILIYGPAIGVAVGLIGAFLPSWNARKVKVSEVFAQVA